MSVKLVPRCHVLQGALAAAGPGQTPTSAFLDFEHLVGARMRVFHYYHQGTELFPTPSEISLAHQPGAHRILMMNWKPENGYSWAQVAAGQDDSYIDREAAYLVANFHDRFFLSIHHEPEDEVDLTPGSGFSATDYAAMYRHVVDRLRMGGVHNAVFVMQMMGAQTYMVRPWFKQLWPGRSYVDWLAFDAYETPVLNGQSGDFRRLVNVHWGSSFPGAYRWAVRNHPHMPIMLSEWGVSEKPGAPRWKARVFRNARHQLGHFPMLKAMVYFNQWFPEGDVRVNTSYRSLQAFRTLARSPMFRVSR